MSFFICVLQYLLSLLKVKIFTSITCMIYLYLNKRGSISLNGKMSCCGYVVQSSSL